MVQGIVTRERTEKWKIVLPEEYGFHKVIVPGREDCQAATMHRLNLAVGQRYELTSGGGEMSGVYIKEEAGLELAGRHYHCSQFDPFCTAGGNNVAIGIETGCVFYIRVSVDRGYGIPFFRAFDSRLPLGEIHQIYGKSVGQRGVFMTLNQGIQIFHLIAGLTWRGSGAWTSWPPHQHETDPEEIYCYFDMDEPHFGLHLSYAAPGDVDDIATRPVKSRNMVPAPRGYHPTVASPGTRNAYFWALAVHSHESHNYDLAVSGPRREQVS